MKHNLLALCGALVGGFTLSAVRRRAHELHDRYMTAAGAVARSLESAGHIAPPQPGFFSKLVHGVEDAWDATCDWVQRGCTTAGIGCLECKQPVIDAIIAEQQPIQERAQKYLDDPSMVRSIVADGCDRARKMAEETMRDVRDAMGLGYT